MKAAGYRRVKLLYLSAPTDSTHFPVKADCITIRTQKTPLFFSKIASQWVQSIIPVLIPINKSKNIFNQTEVQVAHWKQVPILNIRKHHLACTGNAMSIEPDEVPLC